MFFSSFADLPHDMMHCVDRRGSTYEQLLPGGGLVFASGASWLLWVDNDGAGESFLQSVARVRNAAQWAVERKPALGRIRFKTKPEMAEGSGTGRLRTRIHAGDGRRATIRLWYEHADGGVFLLSEVREDSLRLGAEEGEPGGGSRI
jgi:hypothetical protein